MNLNTKNNIEVSFLAIEHRIRLIEEAVGYENITELSELIAIFLHNMEPKGHGLNSAVSNEKHQSHVAISLLNATCEIQTAYHVLTIGNIPGVFRQCRIIHEFVAVALFTCIPKQVLLEYLPVKKHSLAKELDNHPDSDFWELYKPTSKFMGKNVQRENPKIKGNMLLKPYVTFLTKGLNLDQPYMTWLSTQIEHVLNPASHGSLDILPYHFASADLEGKGGINYSPTKVPLYKDAMSYLLYTVEFANYVLNQARLLLTKD
ncbi:MAG: hypothetical protein LAT81_14535 [Oceanicaulis sp.]|nr:hypothetical protein [Oceanicaulis sp.]